MSEYLYCRRATDHRFMQFKGLPKYNFRFKNAKKKSTGSKPSASISRFEWPFYKKKNTIFISNQVFFIIISLFVRSLKSIICCEQ